MKIIQQSLKLRGRSLSTPPANTEPGELTPPAGIPSDIDPDPTIRDPNNDPAIDPDGAIRESK